MSEDRLAIFCAAGCVEGTMQRILIAPDDTVAVCPNCRRSYGVSTVALEGARATRLDDGRYRYLLEEAEHHGGRRLRKVETVQSLGLQVGSDVTLVKRGPILIGLADHARQVWFSIEPAPRRFRGGKRFLDFMSAVILLCVLLTTIAWAGSLGDWTGDHGSGALVLLAFVAALCLILPLSLPRLQAHLSSRHAGDDGDGDPTLPPLSLPDID